MLARWYAAWNAHDVDAIGALMTDDVRYEDPSAPTAVMRGRPPVKQYAGAGFAGIPDLQLEWLEEWVTPGGGVIASWFRQIGAFPKRGTRAERFSRHLQQLTARRMRRS